MSHSRQRALPSPIGTVHALSEADLASTRCFEPRRGERSEPRFLRTDVEALAARVHGDTVASNGGGEAAAQQRAAAVAWRENSFSVDARTGKTRKWKAWNSATFHKQQSLRKQQYHQHLHQE